MTTDTAMPLESITALILAGGRGTRMGGVDKALQTFQHKTLLEHVIARLRPQVGTIMINTNQSHAPYVPYGYRVFADYLPNFAGPLAGIATAWDYCETDYLLTAPCDSPFLPEDLAQTLARAFINRNDSYAGLNSGRNTVASIAATAPTDTKKDQLNLHPVFCLMHRSAAPKLKQFVEEGGSKMRLFFDEIKAKHIVFDDAEAFINLNTLQDMKDYETRKRPPQSNR